MTVLSFRVKKPVKELLEAFCEEHQIRKGAVLRNLLHDALTVTPVESSHGPPTPPPVAPVEDSHG